MPLLPEPVLRAAVRWLERLPDSGYRRCRSLFSTHPDFSDITPTQYDSAYSWLQEVGLLEEDRRHTPVTQQVFEAALLRLPWFQDADILVQSPGELPEDALRAAQALGISTVQAFQHVHSLWERVDIDLRRRIGAAGEAALVELLKGSVAANVEHVSRYSDAHGYDIEVTGSDLQLHIEAKATLRRHRLTLFLSRHEYETMVHDPAWQLVAVHLSADLQAQAVCSIPARWIQDNVPCDRTFSGRWESCRLNIPPTEMVNGIPRLATLFLNERAPVIDGRVKWWTERD